MKSKWVALVVCSELEVAEHHWKKRLAAGEVASVDTPAVVLVVVGFDKVGEEHPKCEFHWWMRTSSRRKWAEVEVFHWFRRKVVVPYQTPSQLVIPFQQDSTRSGSMRSNTDDILNPYHQRDDAEVLFSNSRWGSP